MNFKRFIAFLKKLHKDAGKPIMVVVDNVRYHYYRLICRCDRVVVERRQ